MERTDLLLVCLRVKVFPLQFKTPYMNLNESEL